MHKLSVPNVITVQFQELNVLVDGSDFGRADDTTKIPHFLVQMLVYKIQLTRQEDK